MKYIYSFIFLGLFFLAGCLFPAQPDISVSFYTLDYQPPANHMLNPLNTSIRIARFSSVQEMNTQAMLFSSQPGMLQTYNYSRWRAFPADLCGDYLSRDMRHSQLLKVASSGAGVYRFRLEGAMDEFLRLDRPQGSKVRLAVTCTLLDQNSKQDTADYLVFQRNYVQEAAVEDDSPLSLALAMSQAMAAFSQQLQYDIYLAAQNRLMRDIAIVPEGKISGSGQNK